MKKRNLVIVAFMLIAAMTIGIGYAVLSVDLTMAGTAIYDRGNASDDFTSDVYFVSGQVVSGGSGSGTDSVAAISDGARHAKFTVNSLMLTGEKAVFEFVVANENVVPIYISIDGAPVNGTYFEAEYSPVAMIAAGSEGTPTTGTITVTVTLKDIPPESAVDSTGILTETLSITLNASTENPNP